MQYLDEVQPVFYLPASHIFGWKNQSCPNFIGPNHTNSCTLQWVVPKLFHSLAMTLWSKFVVLRNDYVHNADKKPQLCWHIALSVSRFQGSLQKRSGFLCPLANGETDISRWSVFTEVLFLCKIYILKKDRKEQHPVPQTTSVQTSKPDPRHRFELGPTVLPPFFSRFLNTALSGCNIQCHVPLVKGPGFHCKIFHEH